jgi:hypothetical protein
VVKDQNDKGTKSAGKKMRDPKKFKLLGDQAIEGKETKKLPINRWLYPHKRI